MSNLDKFPAIMVKDSEADPALFTVTVTTDTAAYADIITHALEKAWSMMGYATQHLPMTQRNMKSIKRHQDAARKNIVQMREIVRIFNEKPMNGLLNFLLQQGVIQNQILEEKIYEQMTSTSMLRLIEREMDDVILVKFFQNVELTQEIRKQIAEVKASKDSEIIKKLIQSRLMIAETREIKVKERIARELVENAILEHAEKIVDLFLQFNIDKQQVTSFLKACTESCDKMHMAFVHKLDFTGNDPVRAFRKYGLFFEESTRFEKYLTEFAQRYMQCNPPLPDAIVIDFHAIKKQILAKNKEMLGKPHARMCLRLEGDLEHSWSLDKLKINRICSIFPLACVKIPKEGAQRTGVKAWWLGRQERVIVKDTTGADRVEIVYVLPGMYHKLLGQGKTILLRSLDDNINTLDLLAQIASLFQAKQCLFLGDYPEKTVILLNMILENRIVRLGFSEEMYHHLKGWTAAS